MTKSKRNKGGGDWLTRVGLPAAALIIVSLVLYLGEEKAAEAAIKALMAQFAAHLPDAWKKWVTDNAIKVFGALTVGLTAPSMTTGALPFGALIALILLFVSALPLWAYFLCAAGLLAYSRLNQQQRLMGLLGFGLIILLGLKKAPPSSSTTPAPGGSG